MAYPALVILTMFNPQPKPTSKKKKKPYRIKPGKKMNEWAVAKKILNPAFERADIFNICEVGRYLAQLPEHKKAIENHRHWFGWAYAHGKKRDDLTGNELITFVVGACQDCHHYIEYRKDMTEIVEAVIASRRIQPSTYNLSKGEKCS